MTLLVVPNVACPHYEKKIEVIRSTWEKNASGKMSIDVKIVSELPHDGGKIRFIVHESRCS